MAKYPFGKNLKPGESLSGFKDDVMAALARKEMTPDAALSLQVIGMSVHDYKYFGLGKNGTTPEKFLEAYMFLFLFNSTLPSLSITTKRKCFDIHYIESGLSSRYTIDEFRAGLKVCRERIINDNLKQVLSYMDQYRNEEWIRLPKPSRKGKYSFPRENVVQLLVAPETPKALARLYLFGRSIAATKPKYSILIEPKQEALTYTNLLF